MKNQIFQSVPTDKPSTNVFDLGHDRKFSTKMGILTPILVLDTVPGDKITISANTFLRFAPLIAPVMHRISIYTHFFFVPNRLTWDNWEDFITGGEDGEAAPVWPFYRIDLGVSSPSNLYDYLGLPVGTDTVGANVLDVSGLPFAAYQLIYNEYYRDQNLIPDETPYKLIDGLNSSTGGRHTLQKRAWQHDYFTSALPWTQKGPEALLPLGTTAPIVAYDADNIPPQGFPLNLQIKVAADGTSLQTPTPPGTPLHQQTILPSTESDHMASVSGTEEYIDLNGTHYTDLSDATASSIIDLRRAFRLQEWLEKNARGGSRYTESIKVHFGVKSSDARLQRPEYLGGSSQPIKISEVLQTTPSDIVAGVTPQGNMAGHALSVGAGSPVSHFCEEHGYIIGIQSVMPESSYQGGLEKHWNRADKFDYFWPEFQHIGEEAILNQEIQIAHSDQKGVFGYTPRYADYKFMNSTVHGDYRETLDFWHLGRIFDPNVDVDLNQAFIEMDEQEIDRIFAVQDGTDNLWCHTLFNISARRPMAFYGEPKF